MVKSKELSFPRFKRGTNIYQGVQLHLEGGRTTAYSPYRNSLTYDFPGGTDPLSCPGSGHESLLNRQIKHARI